MKTLIWKEWRKIRWAALGLLIVQLLLRILPIAGLMGQATSREHATTLLRTQLIDPGIADVLMLLGIVLISLMMMADTQKRNPYELSAALPVHPSREMAARAIVGGMVAAGTVLAAFAGAAVLRIVYEPILYGRVLWSDMAGWLAVNLSSYLAVLGVLLLLETVANPYAGAAIGLGLISLPLYIHLMLGSYLYNRFGLDLPIDKALAWFRFPDMVEDLGFVGFGIKGLRYHILEKSLLYTGLAVSFLGLGIWLKGKAQKETLNRAFRFSWAGWGFRIVFTLFMALLIQWLVVAVMDIHSIGWVHDICLMIGLGIGWIAAAGIAGIGKKKKRRRVWPVAAVLAVAMAAVSLIPQGWTPELQRRADMRHFDTEKLSAFYPVDLSDTEKLQAVWDEMSVCLGKVEALRQGSYTNLYINISPYLAEKSDQSRGPFMANDEFDAYWDAGQGPKQLAVLYAQAYFTLVPGLKYVSIGINDGGRRESWYFYSIGMRAVMRDYEEYAGDPDLWKKRIEEKILNRKVDTLWDKVSHSYYQSDY
jgi:hypothetical protein